MSHFSFSSLEHEAASAFEKLHAGLVLVEKFIPKVQKAEPTVEAIATVVGGPTAAEIVRAAFSVLGTVAVVVKDADQATVSAGVSVKINPDEAAALKQLLKDAAPLLAQLGIKL
jgi:hypothetical protein